MMLLSAGVAIVVVSALYVAVQAPATHAGFGPGTRHRPNMGVGPTPTSTPPLCLQSYSVITDKSPSPSNGLADDQLNGIVAVSATNIWAVGSSNGNAQGLIEHYNGTSWSIVASPTPSGSVSNALYGIAAVSANDIWAVGQTTPNNGTSMPPPQPLIEHWNGTTWSLIASPAISGTIFNVTTLRAVTALTSNDIWAVGGVYSSSTGLQMLVEHWNGSQWSVIPDPVTGGSGLNSLVAFSDTNVWAVGIGPGSNSAVNGTTLIEHYDGTSWSVVTSPSPGTWYNTLTGVAAASPTNIWAVGSYTDYDSQPYNNLTLVEHYNGSSWSTVASPNPGDLNDTFHAVGIDSLGNVWAAGEYESNGNYLHHALVAHLSQTVGGTMWTQETTQPGDAEGDPNFQLNAISVLSVTSIWFAGFDYGSLRNETLIEKYRLRPAFACPLR